MKPAPNRQTRVQPEFFSAQVSEARRFYLDLDPPASKSLVVVCGGSELCAPDYHIQRSDFRYYSIEYVARGEGVLRIKNQEHRLGPGSLFAYGPGVAHEISCNPKRPLVKHFVDFAGRLARGRLREAIPESMPLVQTSTPDEIRRLFDDMTTAGLRYSPFNSRICAAILGQLMLRIAETSVPPGTIGTLSFETYERCRAYIDAHYLELRKVTQIAKGCRVDPAYLCRLFSRYHHQSPHEYGTLLRMRDAAKRLEVPGAMVKQVAREMGFGDPFQFSRTFRRAFGISPREFVRLLPTRRR